MKRQVDTRFATPDQFNKVLLRWMPHWASRCPEGRLVAAIITQAWADGIAWFFRRDCQSLQLLCDKTGLHPEHLERIFKQYNRPYAKQQKII